MFCWPHSTTCLPLNFCLKVLKGSGQYKRRRSLCSVCKFFYRRGERYQEYFLFLFQIQLQDVFSTCNKNSQCTVGRYISISFLLIINLQYTYVPLLEFSLFSATEAFILMFVATRMSASRVQKVPSIPVQERVEAVGRLWDPNLDRRCARDA